MSIKTIIAIVAVTALAGVSWFFRDAGVVQGAASTAQTFVKDALPDNKYTAAKPGAGKAAGKEDRAKEPHTLKKCVSDVTTIYTDEACPPGTRQAPIREDNLTVVPGQRAGGPPKGGEKTKQEAASPLFPQAK